MDRQEANRLILKQIAAIVEGSTDLRFHQILFNMGINENEISAFAIANRWKSWMICLSSTGFDFKKFLRSGIL